MISGKQVSFSWGWRTASSAVFPSVLGELMPSGSRRPLFSPPFSATEGLESTCSPLLSLAGKFLHWKTRKKKIRSEWEIMEGKWLSCPGMWRYYTKNVFYWYKTIIAKAEQAKRTRSPQRTASSRLRNYIPLVFLSHQIQLDNVMRIVWVCAVGSHAGFLTHLGQ